jgi:hypothetical protein
LCCLDVEVLIFAHEKDNTHESIDGKIAKTSINDRKISLDAFKDSSIAPTNIMHRIENINQWSMFLLDPRYLEPWCKHVLEKPEVMWYISIAAQTCSRRHPAFVKHMLQSYDSIRPLWSLWKCAKIDMTHLKLSVEDLRAIGEFGCSTGITSKLAWNRWCEHVNKALNIANLENCTDIRKILKVVNVMITRSNFWKSSKRKKIILSIKDTSVNLVLLQIRLKSIIADLEHSEAVFDIECLPREIETDFTKLDEVEKVILSCVCLSHPNFKLARDKGLVGKCFDFVIKQPFSVDSNASLRIQMIQRVIMQHGMLGDLIEAYKFRFGATDASPPKKVLKTFDTIVLHTNRFDWWNFLAPKDAGIPSMWKNLMIYADISPHEGPIIECPVSRQPVNAGEYTMKYKHCSHELSARAGFEWFLESKEVRCPICNQDTTSQLHTGIVSTSTILINEDLEAFWTRPYVDIESDDDADADADDDTIDNDADTEQLIDWINID